MTDMIVNKSVMLSYMDKFAFRKKLTDINPSISVSS
jgi:hypothetical protein